MENNKLSFEDDYVRGKYARELRGYFERYNIQDWWVSPSPKTPEILIHPLNGKLENEREISRISIQINGESKFSFGLSGYNYKIGQFTKDQCVIREYGHNVHIQKPKKDEKGEQIKKEEKEKPGRWWLTKSFNNLEEIACEFRDIQYILNWKD